MNTFKELRISRNMTLKELSDKTKIPVSSLSAYERGTRQPKVDSITILANTLNVSAFYLSNSLIDSEQKEEMVSDFITNLYIPIDVGIARRNMDIEESLPYSDSKYFQEKVGLQIAYSDVDYDFSYALDEYLELTQNEAFQKFEKQSDQFAENYNDSGVSESIEQMVKSYVSLIVPQLTRYLENIIYLNSADLVNNDTIALITQWLHKQVIKAQQKDATPLQNKINHFVDTELSDSYLDMKLVLRQYLLSKAKSNTVQESINVTIDNLNKLKSMLE